jgi:tetratricopeptide (TPR) repeat protein
MSSPTLPLGGVGRPGWARGNRLKRATNTHWGISAALIRAIGDRSWERPILRLLGLAHSAQGRFGEAMVCLEQSLALGRAGGDRHGEAYGLQSLGEVYGRQGRLEDAVSCLEQSLVLAATTGDRAVEAFALHTLGDIRREQGRLEEAFGCLEPSLAALRDLGFRSWEADRLDPDALRHAPLRSQEARPRNRLSTCSDEA